MVSPFQRGAKGRPLVYAHRGAGRRAPDNSLRALGLGLDEGADGVEVDVRRCRSGEVILSHDAHLPCGAGQLVPVGGTRFCEMSAIRVGGEPIAQLDDALDLVSARGALMNVEVKGDVPDRVGSARAVAGLLAKRSAAVRDRVIVSSFSPLVCGALREALPGLSIAFLFDRAHTWLWRARLLEAWLAPDAVHAEESMITRRSLASWHRHGRLVCAWTVNEPARAVTLADLGVDGIITDDVPALLSELMKTTAS